MAKQGYRALGRNLRLLGRRIEAGKIEASREGARIWADTLREALHEEKSGWWYGQHQASAPGEIPAAHLGDFEDSIVVEDSRTTSAVQVTSDHAEHLEYGTENMEARPFVQATTDRARTDITDAVVRILNKTLVPR